MPSESHPLETTVAHGAWSGLDHRFKSFFVSRRQVRPGGLRLIARRSGPTTSGWDGLVRPTLSLCPSPSSGFRVSGRVEGIRIMLKLYVGNLSYDTSEARLRELFEEHGEVSSANLVMDRDTGRPRGFGFVEMTEESQGRAAIEALNGQNVDGRDLTVNEARPRENRGGGGFGGGRGGGFRGGRGGGGGGNRGGW